MRITLLIAGTRGDVQPAIALGVGLKKAGYEVRLVTFEAFRAMALENNLDYRPIRLDMPAILAERGRPNLFDNGAMAVRFIPEMLKVFNVMLEQMTVDFWEASPGSDIILGCPATNWLGVAIAKKLGIPYVDSYVLPMFDTRSFPAVLWPKAITPTDGKGLAGLLNLFTYKLVGGLSFAGVRPLINRCRKNVLGLPPLSFTDGNSMHRQTAFSLVGYSESVLLRPLDWPDNVHVTGYWFLDYPAYQPPTELRSFLEGGPPPVYIGFGSMPSKDPAHLAGLVGEALRMAGQRGILFTGTGVLGQGMAQHTTTSDLYFLDSAPHDWLFPRMAAVVHHGGSGTTAAGLRAGKPSILVPVGTDQLLWAQRVKDLGLGPKPIPRGQLNARRLGQAIEQAVTSSSIRERACEMGIKIRAEDGVGNAVKVMDRYFDK